MLCRFLYYNFFDISKNTADNIKKIIYYKPIQTGAIFSKTTKKYISCDCAFVEKILAAPNTRTDQTEQKKNNNNYSFETVCSYLFKKPAAPYYAAKLENKKIEISKIIDTYQRLKNNAHLITEGAGGLLTPILSTPFFYIDLLKLLKPQIILVAPAGLGSINQVLSAITITNVNALKIYAIFLIYDNNKPNDIELENYKFLKKITKLQKIFLVNAVNNADTENLIIGDFFEKFQNWQKYIKKLFI